MVNCYAVFLQEDYQIPVSFEKNECIPSHRDSRLGGKPQFIWEWIPVNYFMLSNSNIQASPLQYTVYRVYNTLVDPLGLHTH
jgi:hypothetical protein